MLDIKKQEIIVEETTKLLNKGIEQSLDQTEEKGNQKQHSSITGKKQTGKQTKSNYINNMQKKFKEELKLI